MLSQVDADITTEERVSRLEGSYEHMASKSDLAELKTEFAGLRADLLLGFREMQLQFAELRNQFAELRNLIISQRGVVGFKQSQEDQ